MPEAAIALFALYDKGAVLRRAVAESGAPPCRAAGQRNRLRRSRVPKRPQGRRAPFSPYRPRVRSGPGGGGRRARLMRRRHPADGTLCP